MPGRPAALKLVESVPPSASRPCRCRAEHAEILERCRGFPQHGARGRRSEGGQAAHASSARVHVDVCRQLRVLRLLIFERPEVLADIGPRAQQPLLLAAPQGNADGATRLRTDRREDAHGFHHDGAADGVVGRAGGSVPRVEMAAEHDHLVGLVAARDLRDRVVAGAALGIAAVHDLELELDLPLVSEQP